jgi:hypothetical protein
VGPRAGLDIVARGKNSIPWWESNAGCSANSLVTIVTKPLRLHGTVRPINLNVFCYTMYEYSFCCKGCPILLYFIMPGAAKD